MEAWEYKYTDSHVRRDVDRYRSVVNEYLENYSGDFELLLDYKHRLAKGTALTVPMIRATLNCMRFDARWDGKLPSPMYEDAKDSNNSDNTVYVDFEEKKRVKHYHSFEIKALRWNMPFGASTHKLARTVHRVSPDSGWLYYIETRIWYPKVHWECNQVYQMPGRLNDPTIELMTEEAAIYTSQLPGWKMCRLCNERAAR